MLGVKSGVEKRGGRVEEYMIGLEVQGKGEGACGFEDNVEVEEEDQAA